MNRSEEFISLHNKVTKHLSQKAGESPRTPFYRLVQLAAEKDPVIAKHESRLKAYGDLRNAIVHDRKYPYEVIAEPSVSALDNYGQIARYIFSPPRVIPAFKCDVRVFSQEDNLPNILRYMKENEFSQVIVKADDAFSLVTTEGIAEWLTHQIVEDVISISETKLSDVLPHEVPDSFVVIDRNKTLDHARDAFEKSLESKKARLYCVVITNDGKMNSEILGLITPWNIIEQDNAQNSAWFCINGTLTLIKLNSSLMVLLQPFNGVLYLSDTVPTRLYKV